MYYQKISESIAAQHHRKLGFKSELGRRSHRAKAGIMQRISMVALRATARQVIRGVALVGAANVHRRIATGGRRRRRRRRSTTRSGQTTAAPSAPSTAGAPQR